MFHGMTTYVPWSRGTRCYVLQFDGATGLAPCLYGGRGLCSEVAWGFCLGFQLRERLETMLQSWAGLLA